MLRRYLRQGGRRGDHKRQSNERPGVKVEDGSHVGARLAQLVREIVRVDVLGEVGHDTSEDEDVAEYGVVWRHGLIFDQRC